MGGQLKGGKNEDRRLTYRRKKMISNIAQIDVVNPVCIVTTWYVDELPAPSNKGRLLTSDYPIDQFIGRWKASFVIPL